MGLARTPPQVVYPRAAFVTPTPQGASSSQPRQTSLSITRVAPPPPAQTFAEPVTPVRADKTPTAPFRSSTNGPEHPIVSTQSPADSGFTPLSARVTPVAVARPIIKPSENGPLNAHINSLNKQLVELEAVKKDLHARLADSEKKLDSEIARRDRTIRDLTVQHEKEKQEWKDTLNAVQIIHNIAHHRSRYDLEQERLNSFNTESRILQQNVRILVRDHSLTRFQVHEVQVGKESASYHDQLLDAKEEIEELQRMLKLDFQQHEKESSEQKDTIKNLRQQLDQERKARNSTETGKGSLEKANAAIASELESAREELAAAQSRIKELQNGATEAKSTQKSLEKARTKHESQVEKLNETIDSLNEEKSAAEERIKELEKQYRALEKERDKRVKAEVDQKALQKQISELEEGKSKETKKVEAELKKAIKELEGKLSRARAEVREAQESTQAAEMRADAMERKVSSMKGAQATQSAPVSSKAKAKQKEKQSSEDLEESHSKSSDRAVEELVFTDPSEDEDDLQVFEAPSQPQPKAQPKAKPSSSSNPPASTSERPKARPKMRPPPPPKSPSPPPKPKAQEVFEIEDDDDEPPPVKTKPRPKPRPPPASPAPASKPTSKPKASGKGKQLVVIDDEDEEPEAPPAKPKARAAPTKDKAPAKDKEKTKAKAKETSGASNSKRSLDDELDVAEETGEKKKKKRKLFAAESADFNWGAGPGHLDTLGIPTALSPIRDTGDKIPRHRRV